MYCIYYQTYPREITVFAQNMAQVRSRHFILNFIKRCILLWSMVNEVEKMRSVLSFVYECIIKRDKVAKGNN